MKYNDLLASFEKTDNAWHVDITEDWMQGRTTYGGLSAALCLHAVKLDYPDLPPLRSSQVNFIGPAGGPVSITTEVMRQGKSVAFIEARIVGEKGLATHTVFCFGAERESKFDLDFTQSPDCASLEDSKDFFELGPGPVFTQHFDCRLAKGGLPVSGSEHSEHFIWIRFKDDVPTNETTLLAIGDMPPPAVLPMFKEFAPVSSINWAVNFTQDKPTTKDGWWLMRTAAEDAKHGYSSQDMQVWNSDLELVMTGRQSVAIFY